MFQVKDIHIIFRVEARLFFLQHIKAKKFFQRTGWAKLFFLAKSSVRLFFQKLFQPPPDNEIVSGAMVVEIYISS